MRCLLVAIGLLSAPLGVLALTWDFDEGTTWGWTAHESMVRQIAVTLLPLQCTAKSKTASGALRRCRDGHRTGH